MLLLASVMFQVLGVEAWLWRQGLAVNITGLLVFSALLGFGGSFVSLLMSKTIAKLSTGTRTIGVPQTEAERWLVATVEQLAREAGIGMPEVGIFPMQQVNAFATGWSKNNALVVVSEGLLARFDQSAIRAVLAHEIAHVANGDMVTMALLQGVLNTFVLFLARLVGLVVDRVLFKNERGYGMGYFMVSMLAQVVLGVLATVIISAFSRYREYRADAGGASLAGHRAMIHALQCLQHEQNHPAPLPEALSAFGIRHSASSVLAHVFNTHPPLSNRIRALEKVAAAS
ncbi:MAG: protease HtpX [Gammaproteobacteria bacterium]